MTWSRVLRSTADLPAECCGAAPYHEACAQESIAAPGAYRATISYTVLDGAGELERTRPKIVLPECPAVLTTVDVDFDFDGGPIEIAIP